MQGSYASPEEGGSVSLTHTEAQESPSPPKTPEVSSDNHSPTVGPHRVGLDPPQGRPSDKARSSRLTTSTQSSGAAPSSLGPGFPSPLLSTVLVPCQSPQATWGEGTMKLRCVTVRVTEITRQEASRRCGPLWPASQEVSASLPAVSPWCPAQDPGLASCV